MNLTLQLGALGYAGLGLRWVSSGTEALTILREVSFDCVLIQESADVHEAEADCESVLLLQAIRASGCDDPVVIVSRTVSDSMWATACADEGEILLTANDLESQALVPVMKRAINRVDQVRENRRLALADHRRLNRERDEAGHLLEQQRRIIVDLGQPNPSANRCQEAGSSLEGTTATAGTDLSEIGPQPVLPAEIGEFYQELLRTYVIMGSGNLDAEIFKLAELLSLAGLTQRQALRIHLERVEQLIRGLGNRSARHVLARADLLALDLLLHMSDCRRRRGTEESRLYESAGADQIRPPLKAA